MDGGRSGGGSDSDQGPGGNERRRLPLPLPGDPRVVSCSLGCLPIIVLMCGLGLLMGFQLGNWLATGLTEDSGALGRILAIIFISIGISGLLRQALALFLRRRRQ